MIEKRIKNSNDISDTNFKKLSIQVSLNGLSFCVADTVSHQVLLSDTINFPEELNPEEMLTHLKGLFKKYKLDDKSFDEITVIHRNRLFGLVPKPLFNPDLLSDYLKFNTKLFSNDALTYDEVEHQDMVVVYVPYTNVNNYIYDLFGEFNFFHDGTIIISSLLNTVGNLDMPICFVHVSEKQMDICVATNKKLLLYNSFSYETKEDFIYYLRFAFEQLELDSANVPVKFFGAIEEDDDCYTLCLNYIANMVIFIPSAQNDLQLAQHNENRIDFTVLNSL